MRRGGRTRPARRRNLSTTVRWAAQPAEKNGVRPARALATERPRPLPEQRRAADVDALVTEHLPLAHFAVNAVASRISLLPGRGACRFPDGVAGFAWSALRVFGTHLDAHRQGRCEAALQQHDHRTDGRTHVHAG